MNDRVDENNINEQEIENDLPEYATDSSEEQILYPIDNVTQVLMSYNCIDPALIPKSLLDIMHNVTPSIKGNAAKRRYFDTRDTLGRTALHIATHLDNIEIVKKLIPQVNVNAVDFQGNISLHYSQSLEMTKLLCEAKSNINWTNNINCTPIQNFVSRNMDTVLHYLLMRGADTEIKDYSDYTPLHNACFEEHLNMVQILLYHGANTTTINDDGLTPLMIALHRGNSAIVEELWPYLDIYEIDRESSDGCALFFHIFMFYEHRRFLFDFLEMRPSIANAVDPNGKTAIYNLLVLFMSALDESDNERFLEVMAFVIDAYYSPYELIEGINQLYENEEEISHLMVCNSIVSGWEVRNFSKNEFLKVLYLFLSHGMQLKANDYWAPLLLSKCPYTTDILPILFEHCYELPLIDEPPFFSTRITYFPFSRIHIRQLIFVYYMQFKGFYCTFYENLLTFKFITGIIKLPDEFNKHLYQLSCLPYNSKQLETINEIEAQMFLIFDKLLEISNVPSLLELSRDTIRKVIIDKIQLNPRGCLLLINAVKSLPIPQRLQDVLMFKVSIYTN